MLLLLLLRSSAIGAAVTCGSAAWASGLDVQLKDLRGSYFYVMGRTTAPAKECIKLVLAETKKYGRLTHCDPEEDHVMCKTKAGEKIYAFEGKDACEASRKKGVEPVTE